MMKSTQVKVFSGNDEGKKRHPTDLLRLNFSKSQTKLEAHRSGVEKIKIVLESLITMYK